MKTFKNLFFSLLLISAVCANAQDFPFQVQGKGTGEPILFFPGFTCTGEVWEETVAELAKNYECRVFTFAGFGRVPGIEKPWSPKIKEGVLENISDNTLNDPTLVGYSLGGALALWMASEGNSYKELIIVDTLPSTGALMIPNFKSEYMVYDVPYDKQLLAMGDADFESMALQMASGMTVN